MTLHPIFVSCLVYRFRYPIHSWKDSTDGGSARRKANTYTQDSKNTEHTDTEIFMSPVGLNPRPKCF
jgi:hypothetical protein